MLSSKKSQALIAIVSLIVAGEMVFSLPFHIARYFRPSFLSSYELSNTQLGDVFFYYGTFAFLGYFLGALVTDKFQPKILIIISLVLTGTGGFVLLIDPSITHLKILYGFWGLSTICLFWSPLIKSTRFIGGNQNQGTAFGFLDGGRGLCAALVASMGVLIFSRNHVAKLSEPYLFFQPIEQVIIFYIFMTFTAALFVFLFLPTIPNSTIKKSESKLSSRMQLLKKKFIWLQALIVACSYACYKGLDHFSLYLYEVHNYSAQDSASIVAKIAYLRVIGAIFAGLLSNKFQPSIVLIFCFFFISINFFAIGLGADNYRNISIILVALCSSALVVFGLRGVYFTLLSETKLPMAHTGFLVGLISVFGFAPDIFFAPIAGRILDSFEGNTGHSFYFYFLGILSLIGFLASITLARQKI